MTINLLNEFEKRYTGDPSQTEAICEEIAFDFNLDVDEVTDYVYLYRYYSEDLNELEDCLLTDY
jgi:hypothetical protein